MSGISVGIPKIKVFVFCAAWSKLGNVSDPWGNASLSGSDDSNWKVDANWANFDENFTGGAPSGIPNPTPTSSPSSASDNTDRYYLFGGARSLRSVANDFSNISIRDERRRDSHFGGADLVNGGEWSGASKGENARTSGAGALDDSDGSFSLSSQFGCFGGGPEKDVSEMMLDLESICGNTLAEKIANAENDIRSKDEIRMRGLHEQQQQQQQCLQSDFLNANSCSSESSLSRVDSKDEVRTAGCEEEDGASSHHEFLSETGDHEGDTKGRDNGERLLDEYLGAVASPLADCLTENSVDFMTAENKSSSAESSVEFGDADNSLELDDEMADEGSSIVGSPCGDSSVGSSEMTLPAIDSDSDANGSAADTSDSAAADTGGNVSEDSSRDVASVVSREVCKDAAVEDNRVAVADTSEDSGKDVTADASSPSTLKGDPAVNDCNESGEVLCENVPIKDANKFGDKCNNGATELENDPTTMDAATVPPKTHSLANGDVADGDNLTNCGE